MSEMMPKQDVERVQKLLRDHDIQTVVCAMPDLWGRLVGKRVLTKAFEDAGLGDEGLHASVYLFCVDMDMNPQEGYALTDWDRGFQDCRFMPDLSTFRLIPWMDRTAIVLCDPADEATGELMPIAPRVILKQQLEKARTAGYSLKCASELEFFLYRDSYQEAWDKRFQDLNPLSRFRADYHILQSSADEGIIGRIREQINATGVEVEFSKSEWGLGQQEINLKYAEALEMADRHILYKTWVKELVTLEGMSATFMAKVGIEEVGSSCHIHASLWNAEGNEPRCWDGTSPHNMSDGFSKFLGGLTSATPEFALLYLPTVNSYKRLQPESFAPTAVAVGLDNRTAAFRLVGHEASFRVENRIPGADVNPYLALAAMTASGLHGMASGIESPAPYDGNAYLDENLASVPLRMGEAIERFRSSTVAATALGDAVHAHLVHFYERELEAYEKECITDWEFFRYFERI
jgi:glutamine synthetase